MPTTKIILKVGNQPATSSKLGPVAATVPARKMNLSRIQPPAVKLAFGPAPSSTTIMPSVAAPVSRRKTNFTMIPPPSVKLDFGTTYSSTANMPSVARPRPARKINFSMIPPPRVKLNFGNAPPSFPSFSESDSDPDSDSEMDTDDAPPAAPRTPNFFTTAKGTVVDLNTLSPDECLPSIEPVLSHVNHTGPYNARELLEAQALLWVESSAAIAQICRDKQAIYNARRRSGRIARPKKQFVLVTPLQRSLSDLGLGPKKEEKAEKRKATEGKTVLMNGGIAKAKPAARKIVWKVTYSSSSSRTV